MQSSNIPLDNTFLWCLFKTEKRKPSIVHFDAAICQISFVISIRYCTCYLSPVMSIYIDYCGIFILRGALCEVYL